MQNFLVKVRFNQIAENGRLKRMSRHYLVKALSFAEAEANISDKVRDEIPGEFTVSALKIGNFSEIFPNPHGGAWFRITVAFLSYDEKSNREKKTKHEMLVQANDIDDSLKILNEKLTGSISDYTILIVAETKICEVYDI